MSKTAIETVRQAASKFEGELLDLLVGQPYYGPPATLAEALAEAARQRSGEYGPPGGLPGLKAKLCELESKSGFEISSENIVIGNGSKGLLFGLLSALPGNRIIVPTPAYPAMLVQPKLISKQVEPLPLETPFRLSANDLDRVEGTDGILVVSSPSNPTGMSIEPTQWPQIVEKCRQKDLRIIVDEVYRELRFSGKAPDWDEIDPGLETVVIVRSFSKSHGVCGWRLGYVVANPKAAADLTRWQSTALNPPSTPVQRAFEDWLPGDNSQLTNILLHFQKCAKRFAGVLLDFGYKPAMPEGGLYVFADARKVAGKKSTEEFCVHLAGQGILLWPGEDFGAPGNVRLSFANIAPNRLDATVNLLQRRLEAALNG